MLDEPMAGMGPEETTRVVETLRELKQELTILLIEHDMEAVFALADRITVLVYGRVIASGTPDDIRANEEVRRGLSGRAGDGPCLRWTMASSALLEVDGIETCYGLSQVLFGISLAIAPGEMVTLMGRNGMGKTTTVRSIMGLTQARAGVIHFAGQANPRPAGLPGGAARASGWCRKAARSSPISAYARTWWPPPPTAAASAEPWTLDKVCALFPRLAERTGNMANQLSGGEQQMLAIGRALMTNPRLLILDEATEGLGAADPRRDLAVPDAPQGVGPVDPGDRQERRGADPHRRPPLSDRARATWCGPAVRASLRPRPRSSTATWVCERSFRVTVLLPKLPRRAPC